MTISTHLLPHFTGAASEVFFCIAQVLFLGFFHMSVLFRNIFRGRVSNTWSSMEPFTQYMNRKSQMLDIRYKWRIVAPESEAFCTETYLPSIAKGTLSEDVCNIFSIDCNKYVIEYVLL